MKKIIFLSVSCVLISLNSVAQNTFPSSGNAGIGVTSPTSPLQINSSTNGIITLKTTDNEWLYTNWIDNTNTRRTWMGLGSDLSSFNIKVENGTDKILFNGGNVGIGTTNPTAKLHVVGNLNTTDHINATQHISVSKGGSYRVAMNGQGHGYIIGRNDAVENKFSIHSNGVSYFNGGNVGIGTITPDQALVVQGNIAFDYGDTKSYNGFRREGVKTEYYNIITGGTAVIHEFTGSNGAIMSLKNDGKIGIGTTTPDSKLAVNGKIHAKEVKVDLTGWPDYVFENDYELLSLQEVEYHIATKGHLPNIPSAVEVEKEGIQLGEMNAKLLQKIEELTLYMIAQNKKIEKLQQEVEGLKKR
ncbi:tail fiber protein [Aquimarina algiphila]|uniref:tail fiber protein n=1 Tax=Aquimarina algiphila TaxID=2047982 RepID=UPI00249237D8|nr:tail fiber protein [Aquimarina algiphila]